jgi:hypothetical protein
MILYLQKVKEGKEMAELMSPEQIRAKKILDVTKCLIYPNGDLFYPKCGGCDNESTCQKVLKVLRYKEQVTA